MKEIKLTQNQVTLVDDEDFEWLNQWKWYALKHRNTFYARRNSSTVNGKRTVIKMHHVIIGKPPKGLQTDHKNGNGLDNQRQNLRFVTNRQNGQNLKNINKTSQFPGVHWHKQNKKWRTAIRVNNKEKHIGMYYSEIDAYNAYKQAVETLGEKVIGID